jgi:hypothetical protein
MAPWHKEQGLHKALPKRALGSVSQNTENCNYLFAPLALFSSLRNSA